MGSSSRQPRSRTRSVEHRAVAATIVALAFLLAIGCATGAGSGPPPSSTASPPAGASAEGDGRAPAGVNGEPEAAPVPPATVLLPTTAPPGTGPPARTGDITPATFAATSSAMRQRVGTAGGRGYVLVVRDGVIVYEESFGGMQRTSAVPVASTAKMMTSTLLLTLVDEGKLTLEDKLSRFIPSFASADAQTITIRQMLNHTSGIKQQDCIWATGASMPACVDRLAAAPLEFEPGSAFSYGNASYHVIGRVIEVITGKDFVSAFDERVGRPLGFTGTTWPGAGANPSPAAGAMTTVEDSAHLLDMLMGGGVFRGTRVLSPASVREIQRDQVVGYDTSKDYAVGITRIPTYGLGTWRDRVDANDDILVVSGNGALGYYPWIDHQHRTYGIVAVNDQRGAEVAVPASRKVIDAALADTASAFPS